MSDPSFDFHSISNVPVKLLPYIGLVMVSHAAMDKALHGAISLISGMDYSSSVSILSDMFTSKRADILANLARAKEPDLARMVKLIVLGEQVRKFSEERNRIAHQVPFWFNEETSEIGFFNDKNTTIPQISIRPPYVANIKSLTKLAQQMNLVAIWLSALEPKCLPEGVTLPSNISAEEIGVFLRKHLTHHPMWDDDARFPWPDIFNRKKKEEARKPQNVHRVLQGASCSESV